MIVSPDYFEDGIQVILTTGDSLDDVPESHRAALSPEIRAAFADPYGYFIDVADRAPLRSFGTWLRTLTEGRWELILHRDDRPEDRPVGHFRWYVPGIGDGLFLPGAYADTESVGHPDFRLLYSVIRKIEWSAPVYPVDYPRPPMFEGLLQPEFMYSMTGCELPYEVPGFPAATSTIFGHTDCGDMFVHTAEGMAGFCAHDECDAYTIGTIPEMLDRMFGMLMQGQAPHFEYDPAKR